MRQPDRRARRNPIATTHESKEIGGRWPGQCAGLVQEGKPRASTWRAEEHESHHGHGLVRDEDRELRERHTSPNDIANDRISEGHEQDPRGDDPEPTP